MSIVIKNLQKSFGNQMVLRHLSMELEEGKCHVLMGPSGCGKTTLFRILMGLETADDGIVSGIPDRISAVFQEDRLCEDFSAIENVAMVLKKGFPRKEIIENLRAIGLDGDLSQQVKEYSGGMKRRVAIVRAVMAEADLLFLDEPFKGLDADTRALAVQYFLERISGKTAIVVTHDREEARMLSTEAVVELSSAASDIK